jgi:hypothetical protein
MFHFVSESGLNFFDSSADGRNDSIANFKSVEHRQKESRKYFVFNARNK